MRMDVTHSRLVFRASQLPIPPADLRQAGQILTSPETLSLVASTTIPRNLPVLFRPLDNMAHNGEIVDFAKLARDFTLALFGELSFDVSPA